MEMHKYVKQDAGIEMDMTPMIDIVFLLIIFFMVVTELSNLDIVELILPVATEAKVEDPVPGSRTVTVNVAIDDDLQREVAARRIVPLPVAALTEQQREGGAQGNREGSHGIVRAELLLDGAQGDGKGRPAARGAEGERQGVAHLAEEGAEILRNEAGEAIELGMVATAVELTR